MILLRSEPLEGESDMVMLAQEEGRRAIKGRILTTNYGEDPFLYNT